MLLAGKERAFRVGEPSQTILSTAIMWRATRYASGNRGKGWQLARISHLLAAQDRLYNRPRRVHRERSNGRFVIWPV